MTTLQKARQARGVNQEKAALELGVKQATISRWETAQRPIPIEQLPAISALYGLTIEEVVESWIVAKEAQTTLVGNHGYCRALPLSRRRRARQRPSVGIVRAA